MRFLKTVMLAAVTAGVMATQASAQPVDVTFGLGTAVYASAGIGGSTGGAWYAHITDGESLDLAKAIVYCIDRSRTFDPNSSTTLTGYQLYTFADFISVASVTPWSGTLTVNDLKAQADLAFNEYTPLLSDNVTKDHNRDIQNQIWNISTNALNPGAVVGNFDNWRVLYNGQNQTFLVQVPPGSTVTPEPSTYALMAAGLAGLFMANRRRRQNNA